MTAYLDTLRDKLQARIREVIKEREESALRGKDCDHTWQRFKQTATADNPAFTGYAYFIVQACTRCKQKRLLDYIVETA